MHIPPKPIRYTTQTAVEIAVWPNAGTRTVNRRVKDLQAVAPMLSAHISQSPTVPEVKALIRGLESVLAAESRRGKRKDWTYDYIRHRQLVTVLAWERELLAELQSLEREIA